MAETDGEEALTYTRKIAEEEAVASTKLPTAARMVGRSLWVAQAGKRSGRNRRKGDGLSSE